MRAYREVWTEKHGNALSGLFEKGLEGKVDESECRTPEIMADAAHVVLGHDAKACTGNFFVDDQVLAYFQESDAVPLFRGFAVPDGYIWDTSLWLLAVGGAVGMIGSAVAVTRYTDV